MRAQTKFLIAAITLSVTLFPACSRDPETPASAPPSNRIGPEGGTVTFRELLSPIDGMTVEVPAGAYAEEQTFAISHRPYSGERSDTFMPLTPVIEVDNGGGFADEVMVVTIPIELPEDHFAMGFFVGEDDELEPMPLLDLTPTSITVATQHFSDIVVGAIAEILLFGEVSVTTGFLPGRDDWQFTNYGSFIAPRGHCAGQCLSAAWYYYEKRLKGEKPLHGRFDNNIGPPTPDIWQDDRNAYRWASTVQRDIDFGSDQFKGFIAMAKVSPSLTWRSFLFAMQATGGPQFVGVVDTDEKGGHALVAYTAEVLSENSGALVIADPNYPKQSRRRILYQDGKFSPYLSGSNTAAIKAGERKSYEQICYLAKTALVPWSKIGARWEQISNWTIGDDRFPEYKLTVESASIEARELHENLQTTDAEVTVKISSETKPPLSFRIFWNYMNLELTDAKTEVKLPLNPGMNRLGFSITGKVKYMGKVKVKKKVKETVAGKVVEKEIDVLKKALVEREVWVDFRWIEIERLEGGPEPEPTETEPGPTGPGAVISGIFYGQLQSNTRSSGSMLFVVSADGKVPLRTHYQILWEKTDDFGHVVETGFRFRSGFGSPPVPKGRWKVCAGPRVGEWRHESKAFTTGEDGNVSVVVGAPPPP